MASLDEGPVLPAHSEQDPLLARRPSFTAQDEEIAHEEEEVKQDGPYTTKEYKKEFMAIFSYAVPLIVTNYLQFSFRLTSILFAGRLGTIELGATALAGMTTSITGFGALLGFSAALDTLCPEAFAAGKPHLVGLYVQRVFYMLMLLSFFISLLWIFSYPILDVLIPNRELVEVTASLMRLYVFTLPGFAGLEVGKRYIRSQGSALPMLYFLIAGTPLNIFLHWLFIFTLNWGVQGAPIAVAITQTVLPLAMIVYVRSTSLKQCWGGFTTAAFRNWWTVLQLGFPDFIMVEVDVLSWEIMALLAAHLSDQELAAQTALGSIMGLAFQIPFPVSIAGSFQIATAIGHKNVRRAKCAAIVMIVSGLLIGLCGLTIMILTRDSLPRLYSKDPDVLEIASAVVPLLGTVYIFDSASVISNGVLRGLGRQKIGGIAMISSYYLVGLPWAIGSAFGLNWRLYGLWSGILIGVVGTFTIDVIATARLSFEKCVERSNFRTTNA